MIERALTLGLAAALALAGSQYLRAEHYQAGAAHEQAARQRDLAAMAQATAAASEAARVEEQRRSAAQLEIAHEAEKFRTRAVAAAVGAAGAAAGLRDRATALAAATYCAAPGDPGLVHILSPAAPAGDMLADMLGRLADHAVGLAAIADQAMIAGAACAAAYDALFDGRPPSP